MGNLQTSEVSQFKWEDQYKIIENRQTGCLLLENIKTKQLYMGRQIVISEQQQKAEMIRLFNAKMQNSNPYINKIAKKITKQKNNYCSTQQKYYVIFQNPGKTLKEEIIHRKIINKPFSDKQINNVLENGCKAIKYLRQINHLHQNICLSSFYITKNNQIVLGDPWICPSTYVPGVINYPSFEKILYVKGQIQSYCPFKSDLFSLGCVIIEMVFLNIMNSAYNKNGTLIDNKILYEIINSIRSSILRERVKILCSHNPTSRESIYLQIARRQTPTLYLNNQNIVNNQPFRNTKPSMEIQKSQKMFPLNNNDMRRLSFANLPKKNTIERQMLVTHKPNIKFQTKQIYKPILYSKPQLSNQSRLAFDQNRIAFNHNCNLQRFNINFRLQNKENSELRMNSLNNNHNSELRMNSLSSDISIFNNQLSQYQLSEHTNEQSSSSLSSQAKSMKSQISLPLPNNCSVSPYLGFMVGSFKDQYYQQNVTEFNQSSIATDRQENLIQSFDQNIGNVTIQNNQSFEIKSMMIKTPQQRAKNQRYKSTIKQVTQSSRSFSYISVDQNSLVDQNEEGNRYIGYKKMGMKDGKGKYLFKEGGYYEGNWRYNKMDGYGRLYYPNGKLAYEGNWKMDQFDGLGKVYNEEVRITNEAFDYSNFDLLGEDWQWYEGQLISDSRQGKGSIKLGNGQMFIGNFKNDQIQGEGIFYTINGSLIKGIWSKNCLTSVIQ